MKFKQGDRVIDLHNGRYGIYQRKVYGNVVLCTVDEAPRKNTFFAADFDLRKVKN